MGAQAFETRRLMGNHPSVGSPTLIVSGYRWTEGRFLRRSIPGRPLSPVHPGEILRGEFLTPMSISVYEARERNQGSPLPGQCQPASGLIQSVGSQIARSRYF